jgi:hypothetical protein
LGGGSREEDDGAVNYQDKYGDVRCAHDRLVHIAGPDNPCNKCEYEGYMLAREEMK